MPGPADRSAPAAGAERSTMFDEARADLRRELLKLFLLLGAGALLGLLFGHAQAGLLLAGGAYIGLHLRNLRALRMWLSAPKHVELPDSGGLWGRIYEGLSDLQRSNRKRKKKLAAILAQFQASTAALPDGAVVLGDRSEIVWFNKAAQALLGLHVSHDVGIRIPNLIRHPDFADYLDQARYEQEVEVPSPVNPVVRLQLKVIPYGNDQRLMIVRDVSELHRLETARRDFVANASHELRTPLTVLRGYLDMIEPESRGPGPLAPWRMPISEMRNQAARMELLINDMLKLAKLESDVDAKQDVLDVPMILSRVLDEARAVSQDRHRIEAEIDDELFLFGREIEAQSIFSNLVTNAVRYTPEGGSVRVRWYGDEDGAHFDVIDSGIGIDEADIPRLTERFYRVDVGRSRASGGTGLGLSIVKHALARHEGRLQIRSVVGEGSTFACLFPPHRLHRAEEPPERKALAG